VFASSPSSAGGNNFNLNYTGAYDEMSPPPSAYSDSSPYGDADPFPPTHYPLGMAPPYVPHLGLQQAPLLMHPHAPYDQAPALQLHALSPLDALPGMQGPPLQLHSALQLQHGMPALYTPVPAPTRRRERPRPEERPPRPPKRRIGYYPASPLVSE
jgi:hypothetical protein